jgi:hypothetical protein
MKVIETFRLRRMLTVKHKKGLKILGLRCADYKSTQAGIFDLY